VPAVSTTIRFPNTTFASLRARLLEDSPNEAFAVLIAKLETINSQRIIKVLETRFAGRNDYIAQGSGHVRLQREFIYDILRDLTNRLDADTIIDVHTHPFSSSGVWFSGVDDRDEIQFRKFLAAKFPDIHYGSIALSQSDYSARIWDVNRKRPVQSKARIKTQTLTESWPNSERNDSSANYMKPVEDTQANMFSRTALALGTYTIRRIMNDQNVVIVGVGGLGSAIAENLVHMGFHHLDLIDPDVLEVSNLNRVVGATFEAAKRGDSKVSALAGHLRSINPDIFVGTHQKDIADVSLEEIIADADWLVVATDNHSSRLRAQVLSMKYFVPLISAGVNITVSDGRIVDMSGEIITARIGDGLCLNCLGRLNAAKIASESHPSSDVRETLVQRGYVTGADVKEPAVKTLNAVISSLLVDVLLNQYTGRQEHVPILVFENNSTPLIYADKVSVERRNKNCYTCNVASD
jgi:molybdopterin/thiamine biosynthesis adenylyltransferase